VNVTEKDIIANRDRKGDPDKIEMQSEAAHTKEQEEAKKSAHVNCSTAPSANTEGSSNVSNFSSPLLEKKYTNLPEEFRKRWDEMKYITQCSDVMCFSLLEKHGYILVDAIEHFYNLP
jgi:iron uptake system EfeUOB component EfeO/EfeM